MRSLSLDIKVEQIGRYKCETWFDRNNKNYRYYLRIELESHSKFSSLIVIMLNPSYTGTNEKFDMTVQNVISIANLLNIKEIIILNLYAIVNPDSSKALSNFKEDEYNEKNLQVIDNVLEENHSKVLVAWGNPKNKKIALQAEKIFKKIENRAYTFCKNTKKYPLHPKNFNKARCVNCIGEEYKLQPFTFEESI